MDASDGRLANARLRAICPREACDCKQVPIRWSGVGSGACKDVIRLRASFDSRKLRDAAMSTP